MVDLRSTQQVVETLVSAEPDLRSTQQVVETLVSTEPDIRSTQQIVEVLYTEVPPSPLRTTQHLAEIIYTVQYNLFVPDTDISVGNWTPTPIFSVIDDDDSTCVTSSLTPSNDSFEVGIQSIASWNPANDLLIRYAFHKVDNIGAAQDDGDTITLTVEMKEGASVLDTFIHTDIQGDEGIITQIIPAVKKAVIADPTKLQFKVTANTTSASTARAAKFCLLLTETSTPGLGGISGYPPHLLDNGVSYIGDRLSPNNPNIGF